MLLPIRERIDSMPDAATLTTIASIVSGFGIAMLFFRIQRELQMHERLEAKWIPWADRLLIAATLISLLLVIFPLVAFSATSTVVLRFASAACAAASLMVAGYVFGILAHYRLLFGKQREGPRDNPEPAEKVIVYAVIAAALLAFAGVLLQIRQH
jgi:hypothetical protein